MILGGAALILLGPTSHASRSVASQYVLLLAANNSVHLLAGGFWLGGLVALLPATLAKPRDIPEWLTRLRLFSAWGMAAVGVLILAGSANAIAILDIQGMRWSETYLDWLAIKLVLAAVMIALALTNRFGLMPAIARGDKEAGETLPLDAVRGTFLRRADSAGRGDFGPDRADADVNATGLAISFI